MKAHVGLPQEHWDDDIAKLGGHFIQTRDWAHFQQALGRMVLWDQGNNWSWLATLRQNSKFRYLYSGYGPTVEAGALPEALESLAEAGRAEGAVFVRLEPFGSVSADHLRQSGQHLREIEEIEPAVTSIIDLAVDETGLRRALSSGHRNAINGAERRGVTLRQADKTTDFGDFMRLINATSHKAGIRMYDAAYFSTMLDVLGAAGKARLYLAEADGKVIAGTIIYTAHDTWYYAHAASDPDYLKLQAGVPLLWQAIMDAKAAGARSFDLWGVVAADDQSAKAGYSKFKRAFGGTDKVFAGTWDLVIQPQAYAIYRLARTAGRVARKVRRG